MDISYALETLNYVIVLLYGVVLTASFAGALKTKKNRQIIAVFSVIMLFVQLTCVYLLGVSWVEKIYPLLIHLPLVLVLILFCHRKPKEAIPALFIAYLCCIPRQWLGGVAMAIAGQHAAVSSIVQILCSFPLLWLTMHYFTDTISKMLRHAGKSVAVLTSAPVAYYIFVFATTVYSEILYEGSPLILGLMMSFVVLSYLASALFYFKEVEKRNEAEELRDILRLQTEQAMKDLETMRKSQQQAASYRHDLRHHFQYLGTCLQAGEIEKAQNYIEETCVSIQGQAVVNYCENEAVNLIFSTYKAKADAAEVDMEMQVAISEDIHIPTHELCVILSNALENALNACMKISKEKKRYIHIQGYQRNGKNFFQIENPYEGEVQFKNKQPIAAEQNHGLGTRSIVMTVEQQGGMCTFTVENGVFTLRLLV